MLVIDGVTYSRGPGPDEFARYGMLWKTRDWDDLNVELHCYKIGRTVKKGGIGKFGHFQRIVDMLWNNPTLSPHINFVWNEWSEQMIESACDNKMVAWAGAASAGKSAAAAMFAIVEYLSDPRHTLVIVTSTTLTGAKQRIWKSIDQYWNAIKGLPGNMIPSIGRIKGMNLDGKTYGDSTGIFLLASEKKKEKDALGKLIGIKATTSTENPTGRLILIADELPELPESLVHAAYTNLWANEGFKMIALGNPASYFDAFGLVCKPKGGWDSVSEEDYQWETERGKVLRFDGTESPRIRGDERCTWMYSQEQIDQIAKDYGENSVYYYRMVKAFWAPQGTADTLYAPSDIAKHGQGKVVWGIHPTVKVAALDPSFSFGGDRSMLYFGTYGVTAAGATVLQVDEGILLQEDLIKAKAGTPRSQQIVEQFRRECEKRGVRPEHAAFDSTGAGPFGDLVSVMWSPKVLRVNFSGKASTRPVSPHDPTPASERYANKVSELWAVGKSLLRAGQLKGIDDELAKEMTARLYSTVKGGEGLKIQVEPKPDFKDRVGYSPDRADAFFVMVDLCRERFGFKSIERRAEQVEKGIAAPIATGRQGQTWDDFVKRTQLVAPSIW